MKRFRLLFVVSATLLLGTFAYATDDGDFSIGIITGLPATNTVINLSNSGASNGQTFSLPVTGPIKQTLPPPLVVGNGNLCANVYVFSPDEQEQACCSCPMTPNSLQSFTAQGLTGNPLTGKPFPASSAVIKVIATENVNGICDAGTIPTSQPLANGLLVWAHTPTGNNIPFVSSTLSAAELATAAGACQFIIQNGSFSGICKFCGPGGQ